MGHPSGHPPFLWLKGFQLRHLPPCKCEEADEGEGEEGEGGGSGDGKADASAVIAIDRKSAACSRHQRESKLPPVKSCIRT